ncbi:MAG: DUF979 family protein [Nocardioidaceae bacterium]|nr:DUF979 family protein [Nocardioidaceae bacterium]NUS52819.1 DUF979 family protein [Nocardioidaceae bacterium]
MLVVPPPASPPAALLELKDQDGPIKAQILTAIPLLARNVLVRYLFCF